MISKAKSEETGLLLFSDSEQKLGYIGGLQGGEVLGKDAEINVIRAFARKPGNEETSEQPPCSLNVIKE